MAVPITYSIFSLTLSFGIVIFSGLAAYYTFMWLLEAGKHYYTWLKIALFTMDILWVIVFLYVGISYVVGKPLIEPGSFGALFIRPMIFMGALFSAISARYSWVGNRIRNESF